MSKETGAAEGMAQRNRLFIGNKLIRLHFDIPRDPAKKCW
jgi:hypothetical protein